MRIGLIFFAVMAIPGLACYAADLVGYLRRRRNRYRPDVLPNPSPECIAGEGWRAYTPQNQRYSGDI